MYLTDLAAAAAKSGLTVREVSGWKTRGHGAFKAMKGVVCHHTAGPSTGNYPSLNVVTFGRPGLSGPLCNLGLARDGSVYVVAAGVAWHAGEGSGYGLPVNDANFYTIGIEAESTGKGDWTPAQLDAYPRLLRALADHYGFPISECIGHYEWTPRKIDPHGWPGGMAGMRASATQISTGDEDMIRSVTGGTHARTALVPNQPRTIQMLDTGVSILEGPGRVTGPLSIYLERAATVPMRVEAYTAKPNGKGGWEVASTNGLADFSAGLARLRYDVAMTVPAGYRLRVRVTPLGNDAPQVVQAGFNLDVRS